MERDPSLPGARSPYLTEARSGFAEGERAAEGRGCSWRGTLNADRKANRKGVFVQYDKLEVLMAASRTTSMRLNCNCQSRLEGKGDAPHGTAPQFVCLE